MLTDIRLVIWDLDETFWQGTLSEGEVTPTQANIDRVRALSGRAVMNAICSKNDFDTAKAKLEDLGIWDLFVFPSIQWAPKGPQVSAMLARIKLRPENVLMVDDNALNRAEIQHHNPGIHAMDPSEWATMCIEDWGKDDPDLVRLQHYKQLEARVEATEALTQVGGDSTDFLRSSDIRCTLSELDPVQDDMDRVIEILNRTNQLNFTKRRFRSGIMQLVHDLRRSGSTAYTVRVTDRFGDYGMCGFVSVTKAGRVEDFAFSCRLLDMGVESAVLAHLRTRHSPLEVPFAERLTAGTADWVQIDEGQGDDRPIRPPDLKVFMPTACISEVLAPFMRPEIQLDGFPETAPLTARMLHGRRTASFIYWSGQSKEMPALFRGDYDILNISATSEVMFPAVWVPALGYLPLPIYMNTRFLRNYRDLLEMIHEIIATGGEFLGRRMDAAEYRRDVQFLLAISKLRPVARQAEFSADRYRSDLADLRARLPAKTLLAISVEPAGAESADFGGPWAVLNDYMRAHKRLASDVARDFAQGRDDTVTLELPQTTEDSVTDIRGHLTHRQNIHFSTTYKAQLLEIVQENRRP